jgi:tellurium resistance protein TerD
MSVSLSKGGNISLDKLQTGLTLVKIGLGWEANGGPGKPFDLDGSALVCDANDKILGDAEFVFYNNLKNPSGSVTHSGDTRTGDAAGDDEVVTVDLTKLPAGAQKVRFAVSIDDAKARGQNFGQVKNAYIRILDQAGVELSRYDLSEDASMEIAFLFGELYLHTTGWKFKALGVGVPGGLSEVARGHGLVVA